MSAGDEVQLGRDCNAVEIPAGTVTLLRAGEKGRLTQTLGGSFTLQLEDGRLVRVSGVDADAIGQSSTQEVPPPVPGDSGGEADLAQVWDAMKSCYDPEIPVNIVDLGLIYDCQKEPFPGGGSKIRVVMTLTAPGCGMSEILKSDLESRIRVLPGVREVQVDIAFDPPWDSSRLSDAARLQLGMM